MREILFRGKRLGNGEWAYGFLVKMFGAYHIIDKDDENTAYEVIQETIGQYTGMTDKNGKRIFEGDVVSQIWYDYEEPRDTSFGEVVYCEYDCSFSVMDDEKDKIVPLGSCAAYVWEVEVIGNVHDNPELMEK